MSGSRPGAHPHGRPHSPAPPHARGGHPHPGPLPPERPHTPGGAPGAPSAASAPAHDGRAAAGGPGSPIVPPGPVPALATVALAAVLAGTAQLPFPVFVCAVVVLQAVTAAGWFRLNGMWPARQGIAVAFLAGVTADVAVVAVDGDHVPTALVCTLGVWVLPHLVLHLRNHSAPDERLYALTAALTSTVLTVVAAGYVAALAASPDTPAGEAAAADAVAVGAAGVAAAALLRALPLPRLLSPVVAVLGAAGVGHLTSRLTDYAATGPQAAVLGLAAGLCALAGLRTASYDFPSRFVHLTAGVALPVTFAAPAVYALGRVLG